MERRKIASQTTEGPARIGTYVVGGDIILKWEEIQHSLSGREDKVRMVSR